jgi:hypothetical protein
VPGKCNAVTASKEIIVVILILCHHIENWLTGQSVFLYPHLPGSPNVAYFNAILRVIGEFELTVTQSLVVLSLRCDNIDRRLFVALGVWKIFRPARRICKK